MTQTPAEPGLVQCEITEEWVPEDETVMLHGYRVSARGKQILMDRFEAGEELDGSFERATFLRRLGAYIVDAIMVGIVGGLLAALGGFLDVSLGSMGTAGQSGLVGATGGLITAIMSILGVAIGVAYFTIMHARGGQTVGKMATKLRVITLDGDALSTKTAFVRAMWYTGVSAIASLPLLLVGINAVFVLVYTVLSIVVGVYALANALTAIVQSQRRAIHDLIAGTRVIRVPA